MSISTGQKMPSGTLRQLSESGIDAIETDALFAGRKVVLFAVPGAFTPTCNDTHFPGFMVNADALREKGVDAVACVAVNDPFVTAAWGQSLGAGEHVQILSDGNGDYTRALGLELDLTAIGLGLRSKRYAAIVDDGTLTYLGVEEGKDVGVSSADAVLAEL
ncbi:MAG: peroxiredoxin [Acidobacteriota bacterium]